MFSSTFVQKNRARVHPRSILFIRLLAQEFHLQFIVNNKGRTVTSLGHSIFVPDLLASDEVRFILLCKRRLCDGGYTSLLPLPPPSVAIPTKLDGTLKQFDIVHRKVILRVNLVVSAGLLGLHFVAPLQAASSY